MDVIFAYFDFLYEDFGPEKAIRLLESAREDAKTTLILEHFNLEGTELLERFIDEFSFDLIIAIRASFRPYTAFQLFHSGPHFVVSGGPAICSVHHTGGKDHSLYLPGSL